MHTPDPAIKGKYVEHNVFYEYHCIACDKCYIGYTTRPINICSSEHCVNNSVLLKAHSSLGCLMKIKSDEFSILSSGRSICDLRVKEAYLIQCMKPELNTKYEKK